MTVRNDSFPLWVFTLVASAVVGVIIGLTQLPAIMMLAPFALGLLAFAGIRYPELSLALFLTAGAFKAAIPSVVDLSIAFGVVVGILTVVRLIKEKGTTRIPRVLWLSAGIALLMGLGVIGSPVPEFALDKFLRFAVLGLLAFFGTCVLVRDRASVRRLMLSLAVIGSALSFQALLVGGAEALERFTTVGSGTIWMGRAASLGVLAVIAIWVNERTRNWWFTLPIGMVTIIALLGSGSRGPTAGVVAAVGTLIVLRMISSGRSKGSVSVVVFVVVILTVMSLFFVPAVALERYERAVSDDPWESILIRGRLAQQGLELIGEHPLAGVGTAGFAENAGDYVYPHNILIELWSENGVIAFAMILLLVAVALRAAGLGVVKVGGTEIDWIMLMLVASVVNSMVSSDVNGNRLLFAMIAISLVAIPPPSGILPELTGAAAE